MSLKGALFLSVVLCAVASLNLAAADVLSNEKMLFGRVPRDVIGSRPVDQSEFSGISNHRYDMRVMTSNESDPDKVKIVTRDYRAATEQNIAEPQYSRERFARKKPDCPKMTRFVDPCDDRSCSSCAPKVHRHDASCYGPDSKLSCTMMYYDSCNYGRIKTTRKPSCCRSISCSALWWIVLVIGILILLVLLGFCLAYLFNVTLRKRAGADVEAAADIGVSNNQCCY